MYLYLVWILFIRIFWLLELLLFHCKLLYPVSNIFAAITTIVIIIIAAIPVNIAVFIIRIVIVVT